MSKHVPDSHSSKIERQDRRDTFNEAKSKHNDLIEKHGKGTDTVEDPNGNEQEVTGADCPDCEGVLVVAPARNQYPPFEVHCTGDCNR